MVDLNSFSEEEKSLLVKLPFQVGFNISEADGDGGEENERLEMEALFRILNLLPGVYHHVPLIQQILGETRDGHENWDAWKDGSFDVTKECTNAISLLKEKASDAEAKAFRKALLEVADTVARAAGEGGMLEIRMEPDSAFLQSVKKIMTAVGMIKKDDSANISAAEEVAIDKISQALQV